MTITLLMLSLVLTWAPMAAAGGMLDSLKETVKGTIQDIQNEAIKHTKDKTIETAPGGKTPQNQPVEQRQPGLQTGEANQLKTLPKRAPRPPAATTPCMNTRAARQKAEALLTAVQANPAKYGNRPTETLDIHIQDLRTQEQQTCGTVEDATATLADPSATAAPAVLSATPPKPRRKGVCIGVRCDDMDSSKKLGEKCNALEPLPGENVGALAARKNKCFWEGSSMSAEN